MAGLSLIQKQEPGSGNLKPVLRTWADVRSQNKAGVRLARNRGAMGGTPGRLLPSRPRARKGRQKCRCPVNWIQELSQNYLRGLKRTGRVVGGTVWKKGCRN